MTNHQYLLNLLAGQDLSPVEELKLRDLRARIERQVVELGGSPRFYYAGSYGKRTLIRENYDLDIVAYWEPTGYRTVKQLSDDVGAKLRQHWDSVYQKNVSWELPFQGGFHVDVVPGRALDNTYYEANLHRRDRDTTLKTSIKKHIDVVRTSGRREVIRLMKLWRTRNSIAVKTFPLELMTILGARGSPADNLERQLLDTFVYVRDQIMEVRIQDPANSNNVLSDELTRAQRTAIQSAAANAITARSWSEVFRA